MKLIITIILILVNCSLSIGQKQIVTVYNGYILLDMRTLFLKQNYDITDSDLRNDIFLSGLKGEVKLVEQNEYKYLNSDDSLSVNSFISSSSFAFEFDTSNNILQEWEFRKPGIPKQKTYYRCYRCNCVDSVVTFPKEGLSYKEIEYHYVDDIRTGESKKVEGIFQRIPYQQVLLGDTLIVINKHTRSYYLNGNRISWERIAEPLFNVRYQYYDNGNVKSRHLYNGEKPWILKEFNISGDLISKEEFPLSENKSTLITRTEIEYNLNRSKTQETITEIGNGYNENRSSKYVFENDVVNLISMNSGTPVDTNEIYINEFGDVNSYYFKSNKLDYKYTYDTKGNWIKRIKFINDKANSITIRKIDYFD